VDRLGSEPKYTALEMQPIPYHFLDKPNTP